MSYNKLVFFFIYKSQIPKQLKNEMDIFNNLIVIKLDAIMLVKKYMDQKPMED